MDRRLLKRNCNESLAMSLLEILCSSRSSCSSCILRLRRFMVEVPWGFRGLNPWNFTDLWLFEVSGGFWAWFQWTLRSRQNYNESLAMSLLEILCSSCSLCYSCVLRLRRFVVEVLRSFRGLNPLSFTDLWFVDVFGHFWLDSREL